MEVYWARDCQIVAAPIAHDEVCVAVTSRNPLLKFHDAVGQVPELACRLSGASATNKVRGARASLRRLKRVYRGAVALVGDASGSVDPLTGEGIGLGLRQAAALVEAIKRERPAIVSSGTRAHRPNGALDVQADAFYGCASALAPASIANFRGRAFAFCPYAERASGRVGSFTNAGWTCPYAWDGG